MKDLVVERPPCLERVTYTIRCRAPNGFLNFLTALYALLPFLPLAKESFDPSCCMASMTMTCTLVPANPKTSMKFLSLLFQEQSSRSHSQCSQANRKICIIAVLQVLDSTSCTKGPSSSYPRHYQSGVLGKARESCSFPKPLLAFLSVSAKIFISSPPLSLLTALLRVFVAIVEVLGLRERKGKTSFRIARLIALCTLRALKKDASGLLFVEVAWTSRCVGGYGAASL
jgi:hypothetical protein